MPYRGIVLIIVLIIDIADPTGVACAENGRRSLPDRTRANRWVSLSGLFVAHHAVYDGQNEEFLNFDLQTAF